MQNNATEKWKVCEPSKEDITLSCMVSPFGDSVTGGSHPTTLTAQSTTVSFGGHEFSAIGVWGPVNRNDKTMRVLDDAFVMIEPPHTETTSTGTNEERLYLLPGTANITCSGQLSLFGPSISTGTQETVAGFVQWVAEFQKAMGSNVSATIGGSVSELQKLAITGCLDEVVAHLPEEIRSSITWKVFS